MNKLTTYTIMAVLATTAISNAALDKAMILAKENAAWQAFKDKKPSDFKKVVDGDMVGVYSDGIAGMKKELASMKKWNMKSFKISDFKANSDEPDVAVTSYIVTIEGTYDGKNASGTYNAGTVWKTEKGAWLAIFHTNMKQDAR
jgi:hypothetical protein